MMLQVFTLLAVLAVIVATSTAAPLATTTDCSLLGGLDTGNGFQFHQTAFSDCHSSVEASFQNYRPSSDPEQVGAASVDITFIFSNVNGSDPTKCASGKQFVANATCTPQQGLQFTLAAVNDHDVQLKFTARIYRSPCDPVNVCLNPSAAWCNVTNQGVCTGGTFVSNSSADTVISMVSEDTTTEISLIHYGEQEELNASKQINGVQQARLELPVPNICSLLQSSTPNATRLSALAVRGFFVGVDTTGPPYPTPPKQCLATITSGSLSTRPDGSVTGYLNFADVQSNINCVTPGYHSVSGVCNNRNGGLNLAISGFSGFAPLTGGVYKCPSSCQCGVNSCLNALAAMCAPVVPTTGGCSAGLIQCCHGEVVLGLHWGATILPAGGSLDYQISLIAAAM